MCWLGLLGQQGLWGPSPHSFSIFQKANLGFFIGGLRVPISSKRRQMPVCEHFLNLCLHHSVVVSLAEASHMATKARVSVEQNSPRAWIQADVNQWEAVTVQPTTTEIPVFLLRCWSFILVGRSSLNSLDTSSLILMYIDYGSTNVLNFNK